MGLLGFPNLFLASKMRDFRAVKFSPFGVHNEALCLNLLLQACCMEKRFSSRVLMHQGTNNTYLYLHVRMHECMHVCMYVYAYVYVYVQVYVYVYVSVYVYGDRILKVHTHTILCICA